jgi:hypothetical protein
MAHRACGWTLLQACSDMMVWCAVHRDMLDKAFKKVRGGKAREEVDAAVACEQAAI